MKALPDQIKAAWLWYTKAGIVDRLIASGHNVLLGPKAGIDTGTVWDQWAPVAREAQGKGLYVGMFIYCWMGNQFGIPGEVNLIGQAVAACKPDSIVLNVEVEADNAPPSQVKAFTDALRAKIGPDIPIDNSSVPSWDGGKYGGSKYHNVPYEALSELTRIDFYQNYWDAADVAGGYDWQDGYQRQRQSKRADKIVIPSWIVGKNVDAFAAWAAAKGYPGIAGWEAGNSAYDFAAVQQAWPVLDDHLPVLTPATADEAAQATKAAKCWEAYHRLRLDDPKAVGLPKWEGVVDLSRYKLDARARYLHYEKGTVWSDGAAVDWMHDGQEADLVAAGVAQRYGDPHAWAQAA